MVPKTAKVGDSRKDTSARGGDQSNYGSGGPGKTVGQKTIGKGGGQPPGEIRGALRTGEMKLSSKKKKSFRSTPDPMIAPETITGENNGTGYRVVATKTA